MRNDNHICKCFVRVFRHARKWVSYHAKRRIKHRHEEVELANWGVKEILNSGALLTWAQSQIAWHKQDMTKKYGNDRNFVGAVLHLHQKTPHLHLLSTTILEREFDQKRKVERPNPNAGIFYEGRAKVGWQNLQTSLHQWNRQQPWGVNLERGIKGRRQYERLGQYKTRTMDAQVNMIQEMRQEHRLQFNHQHELLKLSQRALEAALNGDKELAKDLKSKMAQLSRSFELQYGLEPEH